MIKGLFSKAPDLICIAFSAMIRPTNLVVRSHLDFAWVVLLIRDFTTIACLSVPRFRENGRAVTVRR